MLKGFIYILFYVFLLSINNIQSENEDKKSVLDNNKNKNLIYWDNIEKTYLKKLEDGEKNAEVFYTLGLCMMHKTDHEKAIKFFKSSVSLDENYERSWLALAQIFYSKKKYYLALSYVSKAVSISKDNPRGRNFLAIIFKALGWEEAAEDELLKAIELSPEYAEAHFNLALVYMSRVPVPIELLRRHYYAALNLGFSKDLEIEKLINSLIK